ncbi:hypothetical protein ES708_12190 [subsurface metagenome]
MIDVPHRYGCLERIPYPSLHRGLGVRRYHILSPILASLPFSEHARLTSLSAIDIAEYVDDFNHISIISFS